jgi:spore germination cell wall hydrolase CwlJ-like protein
VEYRQLRGKHISIAKKIFYADEERSKFAREYMSEYMKQNNPMDRQDVIEKMVRSRKEYFDNMTDEEYSNFVRNFINASPTSFKEPTHPERVIMSLNIPNLEYNGSVEDSKTYRFKKDNSLKNSATPDFIYYDPITGVEKFVECFGEHWHKKGEDIALEMAYKNNGYEALVLWEYEPLEKQIEKLEKFLGVTIR